MSHRRLLVILTTFAAALAVALAVSVAPIVRAAPAAVPASHARSSTKHVAPPPGAHPYGGSGSTSPRCSPTAWSLVSSPQPSGSASWALQGVAADAANDVWAVGFSNDATLIEHYDGTSWSIVTSPNAAGSSGDQLSGVVALAPNNVWAVGQDSPSTSTTQTLVEHYDGASWSLVTSPNATSLNQLNSVAADAANDIWAVGYATDTVSGATAPLTEHYNGSSWSLVGAPSPSSTTYAELDGLTVVGGQVFAAGYYTDSNSIDHTLVEHYSGGAWSIMTTQDVGTIGNSLKTAAAFSPTNVWVAGTRDGNSGPAGLFEHYDGTSWSVVADGSGALNDQIYGLSAVPGTTNLWAVGAYDAPAVSAFAEQWQGSMWYPATAAVAPAPYTISELFAVAAVSATNAWAVGVGIDPMTFTGQSLIEHYGGPPSDIFCR